MEHTRNDLIQDQGWLKVLGAGAKVKRREFTIIAHGIRINQIQDTAEATRKIYEQNPHLVGRVEILRVSWQKRTIRTGKATGPLQIGVAEPDQANIIIEAGLLWNHELHDCEPFSGECQLT